MSTRRLEMSVDQMKARPRSSSPRSARRARPSAASSSSSARSGGAARAEAKVNSLTEDLGSTQNELAAKTSLLQETKRTLAERTASWPDRRPG